jgi:DNA-binding IclR family transcriptional regulator
MIYHHQMSSHDVKYGRRIQSVARAVRLLLYVAGRPEGATGAEAAAACELAVPTAHHLLGTLVYEGLLAKDARRRLVLGPKALVVAERVARQTNVPEYLLAPLRWLAEQTGETSYLASWHGGEIRIQHWIEGENALRVADIQHSPYRMAHARATGKVLLAFAPDEVREAWLAAHPLEPVTSRTITDRAVFDAELRRARERGWGEDHEEFLEGVACLSAPVMVDGLLIAALTVSCPAARFKAAHDQLRDAVVRAGRSVSTALDSEILPMREDTARARAS